MVSDGYNFFSPVFNVYCNETCSIPYQIVLATACRATRKLLYHKNKFLSKQKLFVSYSLNLKKSPWNIWTLPLSVWKRYWDFWKLFLLILFFHLPWTHLYLQTGNFLYKTNCFLWKILQSQFVHIQRRERHNSDHSAWSKKFMNPLQKIGIVNVPFNVKRLAT